MRNVGDLNPRPWEPNRPDLSLTVSPYQGVMMVPIQMVSKARRTGRCGRAPWHGVTTEAPYQLQEKRGWVAGDLGRMFSVIFLPLRQTPPAGRMPGTQVLT